VRRRQKEIIGSGIAGRMRLEFGGERPHLASEGRGLRGGSAPASRSRGYRASPCPSHSRRYVPDLASDALERRTTSFHAMCRKKASM
jgi:hypothetical protein